MARPGRRRRAARVAALAILAAHTAFWAFVFSAPLPPPGEVMDTPGTVVLGADGTVLQRDTGRGIRIPVALDQVSPQAVAATLAAEDRRFYDHAGVDPLAAARAAVSLPRSRSGASTLTMQLARRLYAGDDGWLAWRKAKEVTVALWLEANYSKDEILTAYLNDVPYGRGACGIEAAARVYFGVSAANLDLAQAAFLAGIPQDPAGNNPDRNFGAARERQRYVLARMLDTGAIDRRSYEDALAEELHLLPAAGPPIAPHAVEMALAEVAEVAPALVGRQGLVVETTLDAGLQAEAERLAALHLSKLVDRGARNAAVVVLDPRTGAVLALVGNAGDGSARYVNLAAADRQPGSALKPVLYAAALERGYTLASPLLDIPRSFPARDGTYAPQNYDRRFHGVVPLRIALASSYNVPAVGVLQELGMDAFLEMAHRLGLRSLTDTERYGPSVVLGGGEVRLLDLTAAYGVFANGGQAVQPYLVRRIRDSSGTVLYERRAEPTPYVLNPAIAWLITDALRDPDARLPGFGALSPLESSVGAAVKTGTTTGSRDNWAVGFSPSVVVGAWVGNADGSPMRDVSGVDGAGPIWRDVIEAAARTRPGAWPAPPDGVERVAVCPPTGLLPGPACPGAVDEWFVRGTAPRERESYYVREASGRLAIDPPPEARAWAADAGFPLAEAAPSAGGLQIVAPRPGAVFVAAPELDRAGLLLRATAPGALQIALAINGAPVGAREGDDVSIPWDVRPGTYEVEARALYGDGATAVATSTFEVRGP